MNLLDGVISAVSPQRGLARKQARRAINLLNRASATRATDGLDTARRGYEGASAPRRGFFGFGSRSSANAVAAPSLIALRDRARDLTRNTPMARVPGIFASHVVGTGITPVSRTGSRVLDRKVNALFEEWQNQALVSGELDFYGVQALMVRAMVEGGEAFLRFLPQGSTSGMRVPLKFRLMEGDQIDESRHGGAISGVSGGVTVMGVAFDADGARIGYWQHAAHPGDRVTARGRGSSIYVPAEYIVHLFRPLRIGQARGVSWFAPIMLTARDLADYLEAALVKARTESCFAGYIKSADPDMPPTIAAARAREKAETEGRAAPGQIEMTPGMITRLENGEDIVFAQPTASNSFESFVLTAAQSVAAGLDVTYDQLTGDLRKANFSSLRAGKIEFRAVVRQLQHHVVIRQLCRPVWAAFIRTAVLAGALPPRRSGYPCGWIAPAFESIDPMGDLKADILAVRSGRMTWDEFVAEWGNDPQTQIEDIARINAQMDEAGIILDTDPRKATAAGAAQPAAEPAAAPSEKDKDTDDA